MKKLIVILFAILLALLSLTACNGTESTETTASTTSATESTTAAESTTESILNSGRIGQFFYSKSNTTVAVKTQYEFEIFKRYSFEQIAISTSNGSTTMDGTYLCENNSLSQISTLQLMSYLDNFNQETSIIEIIDSGKVRILSNNGESYYWINIFMSDSDVSPVVSVEHEEIVLYSYDKLKGNEGTIDLAVGF